MTAVQALLVVDVQTGSVCDEQLTVPRRLLGAARRTGALVVHLRHDGPAGAPDETGTPGWRLHLPVGGGEPVLGRTGEDGFAGTDLAALLEARGVRRVAVCGPAPAVTVRSALDRGFEVVVADDAHVAPGVEVVAATEVVFTRP
ncbi:isochorismatase family protein [Pseudonocardia abyssalis]|uniref:Isochorismatase family protein n=1 Tax=Pseudonocardia abyssalis TaxID=2792008 RepID=A0ABS6UWR4_9PSEU|nr:isochorismatase family protein [Pseudonocardia abyssalis]MBW0115489.1 isochorismatase family protein [Pseudonocardia abyssalis]MBW0136715.1 isochorismatase family protein [Pseudonocardia abyssalis]